MLNLYSFVLILSKTIRYLVCVSHYICNENKLLSKKSPKQSPAILELSWERWGLFKYNYNLSKISCNCDKYQQRKSLTETSDKGQEANEGFLEVKIYLQSQGRVEVGQKRELGYKREVSFRKSHL